MIQTINQTIGLIRPHYKEFKHQGTCFKSKKRYNVRSRGVAQPGSALAWGARGREFESHRSDHFIDNRCLLLANKPAKTLRLAGFLLSVGNAGKCWE